MQIVSEKEILSNWPKLNSLNKLLTKSPKKAVMNILHTTFIPHRKAEWSQTALPLGNSLH